MKNILSNRQAETAIVEFVVVFVMLCLGIIGCNASCGIGGWGPTKSWTITVTDKHVDRGSESSHYMVSTDKGVFECANGLLLGVWNADEIFGKLHVGKSYNITTKGRKWVNILLQEYPYIVHVSEIPAEAEK